MEMNATSRGAEDHHGNYKPKLENRDEERAQHIEADEEEEEEEEERKSSAMDKQTWSEGVKLFIWNPKTREFMGRTAPSWGRILLFYVVFYLFLAGMFALCMYVVLVTLSPYVPRYRDRVAPPGVMIRPHVNQGFSFTIQLSDPGSWHHYVENLEQFLGAYNDSVQEVSNVVCTPGDYFIQDTEESAIKHACQFKRSMLKNCSGLEDKTFGYSSGQPCILLKMNRIIGYRPGYGSPVTVECKLQKGNESAIQAVDFYPSATFDPMYFPYYGKLTHVNYTSPLVAIQFTVRGKLSVSIQCQLNGVGIVNDAKNDRFLGRINFLLTVDD